MEGNQNKIKYIPPEESHPSPEYYAHTLKLEIKGQEIGYAHIKYITKPFPLYYVEYLEVYKEYKGEKYGREILLEINKFIDKRRKLGILFNIIHEEDKPLVAGMYERNGWKEINNSGWYFYNLPKNFNSKLLDKAISVIKHREWDRPFMK